MYIRLEEKDYNVIAQAIVNSTEDQGTIYVDINGLELEISFSKEIGGYVEDDYNNGTGAFVCTDAVVKVNSVKFTDIETSYTGSRIEILAERILKS